MQKTTTPKNPHPVAEMYAEEHKAGHMDRREFMSRATALGVSATAAYGMLGLATPAQAGGHIQAGGTCLLYTSPSPRDLSTSRMPSSA